MGDFFDLVQSDTNAARALYQHTNSGDTWVGFYLSSSEPPTSISLASSWSDYPGPTAVNSNENGGCYIFCGKPPDSTFLGKLAALLDSLNGIFAYRYFFWIPDPTLATLSANSVGYVPFVSHEGGYGQVNQLTALALRNLQMMIHSGTSINLDAANNSFQFSQFGNPPSNLTLSNSVNSAAFGTITSDAYLAMDGQAAGVLSFPATLEAYPGPGPNYFVGVRVGLKYFYSDASGNLVSQFWSVLGYPTNPKMSFQVSWDPLHPQDPTRSAFVFTAGEGQLQVFTSPLRTSTGLPISLTPIANVSALALAPDLIPGDQAQTDADAPGDEPPGLDTYILAPAGSYMLGFAGAGSAQMMCGLSGMETISIQNGDSLEFFPNMPAYAPGYPPVEVTIAQPQPPQGAVLDPTFTTSWATVLPPPGRAEVASTPPYYFSQPRGAALYAQGSGVNTAVPDLLGYFQSSTVQLDPSKPFPFVPYAGTVVTAAPGSFTAQDIAEYETVVISPARKQVLAPTGARRSRAADDNTTPSTTPQGLLVNVRSDGTWSSLVLGRNQQALQGGGAGDLYTLQLLNVDPVTQDAFQSNQLFLVVTNRIWQPASAPTGAPASDPGATTFQNLIYIQEWPFQINCGMNSNYGDYRNVLIFKFSNGKLSDRISNPNLWTNPQAFNNSANAELIAVSQWLQDYIQSARQQAGSGLFDHFLNIVDDENWNGILALRVDVSPSDFPPELQGLLAGIDLKQFNAHHLGIEVSYVTSQGGLSMTGNSSLFGLINYVDQRYAQYLAAGGTPGQPIGGAGTDPYNFTVLTLQVSFENSEIKNFSSITQVTANQLFGDAVTQVTNPGGVASSNSVVLNGSYENHDGQPVYVFNSTGDSKFWLNSNVVNYMEVIKAQFNTLTNQADQDSGQVNSRFLFWGYLNFASMQNFDAFSFGSKPGNEKTDSRTGLFFSNLALEMQFAVATSTLRTFTFDPSHLSFNLDQSTARPASLYSRFPLALAGLVSGTQDKMPSAQGYLPIRVQNATLGSLGATWYALGFNLSLGTPGALASATDFTATLLVAWSPGSTQPGSYNAFLGIKLPGAGGSDNSLSLQGVLKLSIGTIQFLYIAATQAYMLKFNNIALKLFVFKLPPAGNTMFFLFGDPTPGAAQGSLGWYAAYSKTKSAAGAEEDTPGVGALELKRL